jgi:hypothetical protein
MRRFAVAFAFAVSLVSAAVAQPYSSPKELLEAFYEPYFSGSFPEDESQFRSTALQGLYDADAELTPDGEMGAINFDPYIDGQDYDIAAFEVGEPVITGQAAEVEVRFTNFGQPRALTYELVFEDGGWVIDDVVSNNPDNLYRLSEIFAEAAASY